MAETDPERLADHLEDEADELKRHSDRLEQQTQDVSQEWERKRNDPNVPGAPQPEGEEQESTPTGSPTGKGGEDE